MPAPAMLLALALLTQGAAVAAEPAAIVVRSARGVERRVPVLVSADGLPAVRADQLAAALGGSVVRGGPARVRLLVPAVGAVELRDGVPLARAGAITLTLGAAPAVGDAGMLLPVELVTDVLPRLSPTLAYDPGAGVLHLGRTASVAALRARPLPPTAGVAVAGRRGRTVVVDAGHGGPDTGMHGPLGGGPTVAEKDVTLGVARALQTALAARGLGVVMTRTRDTLVALADRGRIANQRRGDLFVSIHVNAANPAWRDPAATRGFETYFLSEAKTEDARRVEVMENESVRFETRAQAAQGDPLSFIINDMAQNEHLRESSQLAAIVQRRLGRVHPGPSRGIKQAGFKVLVTAFMPAVLVEVGYGSNPAEAAYLASARGQREIAEAIAEAADEYLGRYERRVRGTGDQPGARGDAP